MELISKIDKIENNRVYIENKWYIITKRAFSNFLRLNNFTQSSIDLAKQKSVKFVVEDNIIRYCGSLKHKSLSNKQLLKNAKKCVIGPWEIKDGAVALSFKVPIGEFIIKIINGDKEARRAIYVTNNLVVKSCLNPLSFMGIQKGVLKHYSRKKVIRIEKNKGSLENRLKNALLNAILSFEEVNSAIEESKKISLRDEDAIYLLMAAAIAYKLGKKVKNAILKDYCSKKNKNLWEMSMSISYVAAHYNPINGNGTREILKIIAGGLLLLQDLQNAIKASKDYCLNYKLFNAYI